MNWNNKETKKLISAILSLATENEARCFLRDLMTEGEIIEFSKRLRAAEMLNQKVPYIVIQKETGLSSTTVARVALWLNGKNAGYKTIINRINHHQPFQLKRGLP